ncbi:MAG: O-antigen ligase family protein [Akkermansiaceae bacterium]
MQSNKIIQFVFLALMMLLSMLAVSSLLEIGSDTRNVILGSGAFVCLLLLLWRHVTIDAKLLFLIILGYALGGKGFAYVSPAEPIYIGEIALSLCMFGWICRPKQLRLLETPVHRWILLYVIYAGIHLIIDYSQFRLMAIRDSSMAYYGMFFVVCYSLFQEERVTLLFERILKIALWLSVLSMVWKMFFYGVTFTGFSPHTDAYIPLSIAAVLYLLVTGIERGNMPKIVLAGIVAMLLVATKTAALVALVMVIFSAILFGRTTKLIIPAVIFGALGMAAVAITAFVDADLALEIISGGDTGEAFGIEKGEFVGFSGTSEWRWLWWTTICVDTMRDAPIWGQGFGADITGPFLEAWLGPEHADSTGYARYPHNIMITVFGRLGFMGVALFSMLFLAMAILAMKFCRRYFPSSARRDTDIICYGVVVAGMINGILQATYEVPYGAITHWVCLAYLARRYYHPESETPENGSVELRPAT